MLVNFKGSSIEKLVRLLAGDHRVIVQFDPTESSLKMIEKSKEFKIPLTGCILVTCIYVHV